MKKVLILSTIALVALFSSCKKDDPTSQELIVGKWKVTKMVVDTEDVLAPDPDYVTQIELECSSNGSLVFTVKETDFTTTPAEVYNEVYSGTYSIANQQVTVSLPTEGLSITGNLDVTKTRLVIVSTSGDVEDFFSVLEAEKI